MKKRIKIIRRQATLDDVEAIYQLDQEVWAKIGWPVTREMLNSRIKAFPEGQILAVYGSEIIGYLGLEFIEFDTQTPGKFTWNDLCDFGMISGSHSYSGDYMYGITMTVSNEFQGMGIGTQLVLSGWGMMVGFNKKGSLIGSRIPDYEKYSDAMSVEEYVKLKDSKGLPIDSELRLWYKDGFRPIMIQPDFGNDPASRNYGVVVYRPNPFYGWPLRKSIAYLLSEFGPKIIRSNF